MAASMFRRSSGAFCFYVEDVAIFIPYTRLAVIFIFFSIDAYCCWTHSGPGNQYLLYIVRCILRTKTTTLPSGYTTLTECCILVEKSDDTVESTLNQRFFLDLNVVSTSRKYCRSNLHFQPFFNV